MIKIKPIYRALREQITNTAITYNKGARNLYLQSQDLDLIEIVNTGPYRLRGLREVSMDTFCKIKAQKALAQAEEQGIKDSSALNKIKEKAISDARYKYSRIKINTEDIVFSEKIFPYLIAASALYGATRRGFLHWFN